MLGDFINILNGGLWTTKFPIIVTVEGKVQLLSHYSNIKYSSHKCDNLNNKEFIRLSFKIMKLNEKNILGNHNCCYVSLHDDINK